MNEVIKQLSSYNIFNYLLPGAIFAFLSTKLTSYTLVQENLVTAFFAYYFFGLIISRVGSLAIEPILKKTRFVRFAVYEHFLAASKTDQKIEILSEENNMYRSFIAMTLLLGLLIIYERLNLKHFVPFVWMPLILIVLFLLAYRKQTNYITKRVEYSRKTKE